MRTAPAPHTRNTTDIASQDPARTARREHPDVSQGNSTRAYHQDAGIPPCQMVNDRPLALHDEHTCTPGMENNLKH